MATASGFAFGGSSGLFGSTAKTTGPTLPTFGTSSTLAQSTAPGFTFGSTKTPATTSTTTGLNLNSSSLLGTTGSAFSFGKPAASVSAFSVTTTQAKQPAGFGTLSSAGTATTGSIGFGGQNLFGSKLGSGSTATTTSSAFQLSAATTQNANLLSFGSATTSVAANTVPTTNVQVSLENPKDAQVPAPLLTIYQELSKHIKEQRAKKDQIARFSAQLINKATEEIAALKQLVSEGSNGVQRDAIAVENLKNDVIQELKFADIARRVHDMAPSLQHDFTGPMEYFMYLASSFEARLISYRKQLDELEIYLSSSSALHEFSPQDLFNVLAKLNDTFLALASQLQFIHESVKGIKEKYSQYRRVVLNDHSDVFGYKSRVTPRIGVRGAGPCPFSGMAGTTNPGFADNASLSSASSKPSTTIGSFGSTSLGQHTLLKSASGLSSSGMSRSLSLSGLSSRGDNTSLGSSLNSSLFGKTGSISNAPQFQLRNPPGNKRGKIN